MERYKLLYMENKKSTEWICLDKTRNYISHAPKASKYILELLSGNVTDSERPDFLIKNKVGVIGVEHFLIDTMIGRKKSARSRLRTSEVRRIFDKYHGVIEGNEENALNEIETIVQSDVDAIQNFDYQKFISEFERIVKEHAKNVREYKKLHENIVKLAFLIEIPISKNKMVGISISGERDIITDNRFPITVGMLEVLKEILDKVDYVIISIVREDCTKLPYAVYAIDGSKFEESIAAQLKEIYQSFTYSWQEMPVKAKIKLNLKQNDN